LRERERAHVHEQGEGGTAEREGEAGWPLSREPDTRLHPRMPGS